jgi:hypothetical protein
MADQLAIAMDAMVANDIDRMAPAMRALHVLWMAPARAPGRALVGAGGDAALDRLADALALPSESAVQGTLYTVLCMAHTPAAAHVWPMLAHPRVPGALAGLMCDPARWRLHGIVVLASTLLAARAPAAAVAAAIEQRGTARGAEALEAALADAAAAMCAGDFQARAEDAAVMRGRSPLIASAGMTRGLSNEPLDWACGALLRLAACIPGGFVAARSRLLAHPRLLAALAAAAADPGPIAALVRGAGFELLSVLCGWTPCSKVWHDGAPEALRAAPGLPLAAGRLLAAARARGDQPISHLLLLVCLLNAQPPADACVALASDSGVLRALRWCLAQEQLSAPGPHAWAECRRGAAEALALLAGGAAEAAGRISRAPGMLAALLQLAVASPSDDQPSGEPASLLLLRANAARMAAIALTATVAAGGPPARRQLQGLMAAAPRLAAGLGDALRLAPATSLFRPDPRERAMDERRHTREDYATLAAAILAQLAPVDAPAAEDTPLPEALSRCACCYLPVLAVW